MQKMKDLAPSIAALAVFTGLFWAMYANSPHLAKDRPPYRHSTLTITRADGKAFPFAIEVAGTEAEQAYGLMFVRSLPADQGMIFPYNPPQEVAFWMKNTLIPLDMLFVGADGAIGHIVAEAQPENLTPIPSQIPVIAVIEIKGGQAKADGLAVGDKITTPVLKDIGNKPAP